MDALDELRKLNEAVPESAEKRFRQRYGPIVTYLLWIVSPATVEQMRLIEDRILSRDDEAAITFRNSHVSDCNLTAVAVSSM